MTAEILAWSRSILTTTPARWLSLARWVPEELLLLRPAPAEWSALECLRHIVDTERLSMQGRVRALLAGEGIPGFDPEADGSKEPPTLALADEFDRMRRESLALLDEVNETDLVKRSLHAEYGMVTLDQFLHHWAAHDLMHTVQAERALMQPFIRGCGSWVENYADHIAKTG